MIDNGVECTGVGVECTGVGTARAQGGRTGRARSERVAEAGVGPAGETLHDLLAQVVKGEAGRFAMGQASEALRHVIPWLAQQGPRLAAPRRIDVPKGAVIDRVYGCLIDALPEQLRYRGRLFVHRYMEVEREVVHGAMGARHVHLGGWPMVDAGGQRHLGEVLFDLGCLVSDYAVVFLRCGRSTVPLYDLAFAQYRKACGGVDPQAYARYRVHLALHLLRRLYGFEPCPGPLSRKDVCRARLACLEALAQWLP